MMIADFTANFGEKKEDEQIVNNRPYCLNCKEPRFWESPDGKILVRAVCKCQKEKADLEEAEQKKSSYLNVYAELGKIDIMKERYENSNFAWLDMNRPQDFIDAVARLKQFTIDFLKGGKQSVFLYGKPGLGKTELIACIYNSIKAKKIPVVMTSFMEIIKYITSSFGDDDLESRETIERLLVGIDLLILDDLGVEYQKNENSFASEIIYNIVNGRYIRNKPTIFTSNLSLKDLNYQDRVIDRIAESKVKIRLVEGETYRKQKYLRGE